jgi:hypothetical protein
LYFGILRSHGLAARLIAELAINLAYVKILLKKKEHPEVMQGTIAPTNKKEMAAVQKATGWELHCECLLGQKDMNMERLVPAIVASNWPNFACVGETPYCLRCDLHVIS